MDKNVLNFIPLYSMHTYMIYQHLKAVHPDPSLILILPLETPCEIPDYSPEIYTYIYTYIGGGNRWPWPLLNVRTVHRIVIFIIENHFCLAKWPPLLSVASSASAYIHVAIAIT